MHSLGRRPGGFRARASGPLEWANNSAMAERQPTSPPRSARGIIHAYQKYDPKNFPSPTAPPPDLAGAAFEHMLAFGSLRHLSEEELARAIRIDPSMFPSLGPSLESLAALLLERKRKILSTYETDTVQGLAAEEGSDAARNTDPPREFRDQFLKALRTEQLSELERLWYRQKNDQSDFAKSLMRLLDRLGQKYQVDELAAKYPFTGRVPLTIPQA